VKRTLIQNKSFAEKKKWVHLDADSALVLDCAFTRCELAGAILSDALLVQCEFTDVSFYWAQMFRTVFLDCSFSGVDFRGANMEECMFVRCSLTKCDFSRDNLGTETDLSNVSFSESEQHDCKHSAA